MKREGRAISTSFGTGYGATFRWRKAENCSPTGEVAEIMGMAKGVWCGQ